MPVSPHGWVAAARRRESISLRGYGLVVTPSDAVSHQNCPQKPDRTCKAPQYVLGPVWSPETHELEAAPESRSLGDGLKAPPPRQLQQLFPGERLPREGLAPHHPWGRCSPPCVLRGLTSPPGCLGQCRTWPWGGEPISRRGAPTLGSPSSRECPPPGQRPPSRNPVTQPGYPSIRPWTATAGAHRESRRLVRSTDPPGAGIFLSGGFPSRGGGSQLD